MTGPVVAGLDGGGSKTLLALATREGEVTAVLREAGMNPFDAPDWRDVLDRLKAGLDGVGPQVRHVQHAAFAMPGYGEVAGVSAAQEAAAREMVARGFGLPAVSVLNDVEAAFEAAFAGGPGILLLAGTGSMVWGRSATGRDVRVGGWGEAFGDEGSAYWIGRELVARVSRSLDGRVPAPGLAEALFGHLGLDLRDAQDAQDALTGWYTSRRHVRSAAAALAPLVDAQARAGNAAALALLEEAAAHLALHVEAAWRRLGTDDLAWSYAGGAFRSPVMLAAVAERLRREPVLPVLPPIGGSLLRAARRAGWDTGAPWLARLRASLDGRLDA